MMIIYSVTAKYCIRIKRKGKGKNITKMDTIHFLQEIK